MRTYHLRVPTCLRKLAHSPHSMYQLSLLTRQSDLSSNLLPPYFLKLSSDPLGVVRELHSNSRYAKDEGRILDWNRRAVERGDGEEGF